MIATTPMRYLFGLSALLLTSACAPPQKPEAPPGSVAVDLKNRPKAGPVFYESNDVPVNAGRNNDTSNSGGGDGSGNGAPSNSASSSNDPSAWPTGKQRPATREECEELTDIALRLKLKESGITDRSAFDAVRGEVGKMLGERMSTGCVGQSISEEALKCARGTSTTSGLEGCLH